MTPSPTPQVAREILAAVRAEKRRRAALAVSETKKPGQDLDHPAGHGTPETSEKETRMNAGANTTARAATPEARAILSELETPINKARDRVNLLYAFTELTMMKTSYTTLCEDHRDAFIVMIGDLFDEIDVVHKAWNAEWDKRVRRAAS
ncbi:hypothetical protein [Jiella pelagia]|uniref:Uncharacterized protein n=1 Tax=Jiella pelagia TaxID=2986949 RepID=A0ABY7C0M5_9HYPH|nr:hypothetical protein [Jiella pelagia]WAP69297.1 hypothetical protein OH818_03080 [Jiella pelagia]